MSLQINIPAMVTVTLDDGRAVRLTEEQISCVWSFTERGDFGIFLNLLKFLAELNPADIGDPAARVSVLEAALRRVRQGYLNILEVRKLSGHDFGGRYGALTREEINGVIADINRALRFPAEAPSEEACVECGSHPCYVGHLCERCWVGIMDFTKSEPSANAVEAQPTNQRAGERQNKEEHE